MTQPLNPTTPGHGGAAARLQIDRPETAASDQLPSYVDVRNMW